MGHIGTALLALAMLLGLLAASPALAAARVALVIGNGDYAAMGRLPNPPNDADDIGATLRGLGFEVTIAHDADERQFAQLLSNFATAATDADVALFYYSGHGLQFQSENYLLPVDATLENRFSLTRESIPLSDVLSAVAGARTALIYVDACRSFPIEGTFLAEANERITPLRGLAPIQQTPDTFVGFSASAGQTARDGVGRNSPFTTAMLEVLPTPGLNVTSLFNAVSDKVVQLTEGAQKPQSFSGIARDVALVAGITPSTSDGPSPEERAFNDAKAIGTIGAWRAFVAAYPGGFYSALAREAIAALEGTPPAPTAEAPAPIAAAEEAPSATLARCLVDDPSGTALNVRAAPNGKKIGELDNGAEVRHLMSVPDDRGRNWALIDSGSGTPGYVFEQYLRC